MVVLFGDENVLWIDDRPLFHDLVYLFIEV